MVDTVKPQIAELWQGNMRIGYALAVDGKLIDGILRTVVTTEPHQPMVLHMEVRADNLEHVRIDAGQPSHDDVSRVHWDSQLPIPPGKK